MFNKYIPRINSEYRLLTAFKAVVVKLIEKVIEGWEERALRSEVMGLTYQLKKDIGVNSQGFLPGSESAKRNRGRSAVRMN